MKGKYYLCFHRGIDMLKGPEDLSILPVMLTLVRKRQLLAQLKENIADMAAL